MVLDSLLQTALGLEDQDAPAVRKAYRWMLFSSGCSSCLNPAGCTNTSVWRSARTAFAHAEGGGWATSASAKQRQQEMER